MRRLPAAPEAGSGPRLRKGEVEVPATIRDVAKAAGVSVTTVSRALNGYPDVAEDTRQRVVKVATQLHYRPNIVARSLVTRHTQTIGFLVSEISRARIWHYFMLQVLYGIQDRLGEYGYDLILLNTNPTRQREIPYFDFCLGRQLDGAIVFNLRTDDPYVQQLTASPLPTVVVDIPLVGTQVSYVRSDNVYGARLAVEHLVALGHRRIGLVNGHAQAQVSHERLQGYRQALEEVGLPFAPELVYEADFTPEGGRKGARALLERSPRPTALFFASDLMALGALRYLQEQGIAVPQEVAVVGFDDIELAELVSPGLTTVRQRRYEMGVTAVDLLMDMVAQGHSAPAGRTLPPELVVRETT
jgi:LacI family transcriptional regulator